MDAFSSVRDRWRARTRWQSFRYAWTGFVYAVRTQPNLRVHLVIAVVAVGMGVWLGFDRSEWMIVAGLIGLVLICELINTSIEAAVDVGSPGPHPTAKIAKDVAAAAVLMSVFVAIVVGVLLYGPPVWRKLHGDWRIF